MVLGFADSEAVGAGGGGGGGGGGGAIFLWQAPRNRMAPNANISVIHFSLCCFTFPPCVVARRCLHALRIQNGAGSLLRHVRAVDQRPIFVCLFAILREQSSLLTTKSRHSEAPAGRGISRAVFESYYFQLQFGCVFPPVKVNCF